MTLDSFMATVRAISILLIAVGALSLVFGCVFGVTVPWVHSWVGGRTSASGGTRSHLRSILRATFFSAVGLVTGILAGNSRTAVVGDVLPAMLALIGALVPTLSARGEEARGAAFMSGLSLAVTVLVGTTFGAHFRDAARNSEHAMGRRAELAALCKVQELRSRQLVRLMTGLEQIDLDFKCGEYPKRFDTQNTSRRSRFVAIAGFGSCASSYAWLRSHLAGVAGL